MRILLSAFLPSLSLEDEPFAEICAGHTEGGWQCRRPPEQCLRRHQKKGVSTTVHATPTSFHSLQAVLRVHAGLTPRPTQRARNANLSSSSFRRAPLWAPGFQPKPAPPLQ